MAEEYVGVKFRTLFEGASFGNEPERAAVLAELSRLQGKGLIHGIPGNVSMRANEGMVITPTGLDLAKVKDADMVFVTGISEEAGIVKARGRRQPSSESMMHWLIYKEFPKVNAIVHFHSDELLNRPGKIPETGRAHPYGTPGLAHAALEVLKRRRSKIIILRDHGVLAVGPDIGSCHKIIEAALKTAS